MKYACQYAIVRFLPYAETGEFANVGIVLTCPQTGYFNFKLLRRVRRISAFFEELDAAIFKNAYKTCHAELTRLNLLLVNAANDDAGLVMQTPNKLLTKHLFTELIRPREAMIRFDEPRVVLTDDLDEKLIELYEHYVERNFATKQYQEKLIEKQVRHVLRQADLMKIYGSETLGNTAYHVRFPFVKTVEDKPTRIIKPLHLNQEDSTQLYDHGWEWIGKIRKLKKENLLPKAVLFAVNPPEAIKTEHFAAFNEIMTDLKNEGVIAISYQEKAELLKFALADK